jgi:putative nucleotidyltransferase with HDIG domain
MEQKIHYILFVTNDQAFEKKLTQSLQNCFDVWEISFARTTSDALNMLSQKQFDSIITDINIAGMDGFQFLNIVSQMNPGVVRFAFSDNTASHQSIRSTNLVHQMIPRSGNVETLFTIVERVCCLRDRLLDPQLRNIITSIKTLPSVPLLYNRLVRELDSDNASSQAIGEIISQDAAMTSKILQLVNSAFFGLPDNVSSPQRAVSLLGFNTIKALVLGIHIFAQYQGQSNRFISIEKMWKHSLAVSNLSFKIARNIGLNAKEQEDARIAGVLHDSGKLLFFNIPGFFQKVIPGKYGVMTLESEYNILKTSHEEMGAYLLGMWGLPNVILEAVAFHHHPGKIVSNKVEIVTALHIANGLISMCDREMELKFEEYLDMPYLEKLSLTKKLDEWTSEAKFLLRNTN